MLTDNGVGDRSRLFGAALADTGVRHQRTRPYRPQTNGKVERCNRTLLEEWADRRLDRSNAARDRAWPPWVHRYNHHRAPTALGRRPPISRVNLGFSWGAPGRVTVGGSGGGGGGGRACCWVAGELAGVVVVLLPS